MENQEKQYKRLVSALDGIEISDDEKRLLIWLSGCFTDLIGCYVFVVHNGK